MCLTPLADAGSALAVQALLDGHVAWPRTMQSTNSASDNNTRRSERVECCHLLRCILRCLRPESIEGCLLVLSHLLELCRKLCLRIKVLLLKSFGISILLHLNGCWIRDTLCQ